MEDRNATFSVDIKSFFGSEHGKLGKEHCENFLVNICKRANDDSFTLKSK